MILQNIFRTLFILIVLLLSSQVSQSSTYYVDQNSQSTSNTNPGTIDLPWSTIQHAAETLVAGDTVYIREGVYNEHVHVSNGGDASGYIVYHAFPGKPPILDGTGVTESQNGFIIDMDYIKLFGLEIRNWNDNGIWVENAGYLEITDCVIHDVTNGIGMIQGTHDFVLNRVEMHHFDLYGFDISPYGTDCYNGTFNDCIAHTGRDRDQNVDGFAIGHGNQHDFIFNRCEAYNVYDGFDVGENEGCKQVHILLNRCSAHDCWNDGYKLTGHGTLINCLGFHNSNTNAGVYWDINAGSAILQNCTFFDAEVFNIWVENSMDSLIVTNCIIAGGQNIGLAFEQRDASTYQGDYNLFHNGDLDRAVVVGYEDEFSLNQVENGAWSTYCSQDAHSLISSSIPDIFMDPDNYNMHLKEGSPAVDNGTSMNAPSDDYEGAARPAGGQYDIGAYEYGSTVDVLNPEEKALIPNHSVLFQNYPNPFNQTTMIQYILPVMSYTTITVYNASGQRIKTLSQGIQSAGLKSIIWDGTDHLEREINSGIYFYVLETGATRTIRKLIVMK